MLKLYYSIHNSIRIYKRGVVAAYHVVWECIVEQWLGVRRIRRFNSIKFNKVCHIYTAGCKKSNSRYDEAYIRLSQFCERA